MNTNNIYRHDCSYFILINKRKYEFLEYLSHKEFSNLIQEIHYQTKNDEIVNITFYLKPNLEELLKEQFYTTGNAARQKVNPNDLSIHTLYINKHIATQSYNNISQQLLLKHTKGKIFNYLKEKDRLEENILKTLNNNNIDLTFTYYQERLSLKEPTLDYNKNLQSINHQIKLFSDIPTQIREDTIIIKL